MMLKKLYSGFDLVHAMTSVKYDDQLDQLQLLGFFMNAIDQQCEIYIKENNLCFEVDAQIKRFTSKGVERPQYQGDLPAGNNG
jgi:methylmalonyl-CoA mutase